MTNVKRNLAIAKNLKAKKMRTNAVADLIATRAYLGDEPNLIGKKTISDVEFQVVMNWYNYMCSRTDARDYVETYLKNTARDADLKRFQRVADGWLQPHLGWIARQISLGGTLPHGLHERFLLKLDALLDRATEEKVEDTRPTSPVPSTITQPDKPSRMVSDFIGEFDEIIDQKGWTISMFEFLQSKSFPRGHVQKVIDFFKPIADEASLLVSKNCPPDLKEGYEHYTKDQLKKRAEFYTGVIRDCETYVNNRMTARKPRATKAVPVEKKVAGMKFQPSDKELKLQSLQPSVLVGAREVWLMNTKYRILSRLVAPEGGVMDVKGMAITGFDEALSSGYRVSKRTGERASTVISGGKNAVKKMIEELKTTNVQFRMSDSTLIIKAH